MKRPASSSLSPRGRGKHHSRKGSPGCSLPAPAPGSEAQRHCARVACSPCPSGTSGPAGALSRPRLRGNVPVGFARRRRLVTCQRSAWLAIFFFFLAGIRRFFSYGPGQGVGHREALPLRGGRGSPQNQQPRGPGAHASMGGPHGRRAKPTGEGVGGDSGGPSRVGPGHPPRRGAPGPWRGPEANAVHVKPAAARPVRTGSPETRVTGTSVLVSIWRDPRWPRPSDGPFSDPVTSVGDGLVSPVPKDDWHTSEVSAGGR